MTVDRPPAGDAGLAALFAEVNLPLSPVVLGALKEVHALGGGPAPEPAAELAGLMASGGSPGRPRRNTLRGPIIGGTLVVSMGLGMSGVAAGPDFFADSLGGAIHSVVAGPGPQGSGPGPAAPANGSVADSDPARRAPVPDLGTAGPVGGTPGAVESAEAPAAGGDATGGGSGAGMPSARPDPSSPLAPEAVVTEAVATEEVSGEAVALEVAGGEANAGEVDAGRGFDRAAGPALRPVPPPGPGSTEDTGSGAPAGGPAGPDSSPKPAPSDGDQSGGQDAGTNPHGQPDPPSRPGISDAAPPDFSGPDFPDLPPARQSAPPSEPAGAPQAPPHDTGLPDAGVAVAPEPQHPLRDDSGGPAAEGSSSVPELSPPPAVPADAEL